MTKLEYEKCKKLMYEAIRNARQSQKNYAESEKYKKNENNIEWEIKQRQGDQHLGYAQGINQVLATIGFKHEDMTLLSELI